MTIYQLECFIAVAEELNFSAAAERLFTTQPAITYQINALEKETGLHLFERTTRRTKLTAAGQSFYLDMVQMTSFGRQALKKAQDIQDADRSHLTVGLRQLFDYSTFSSILAQFQHQFPNACVDVVPQDNRRPLEQLRSGQLDIGFFYATEHSRDRDISFTPLFSLGYHVLMNPNSPLADRRALHLADLKGQSVVSSGAFDSFLSACQGPSLEQLAQFFLEEGEAEGVRGDVAFAQSLHETGFFKYGGIVLPTQNNYAGIGALNGNAKGQAATFPDPRTGVRAQIQHLKAYASKAALVNGCVDPRFSLVTRGSAQYVEWLGASDNPNGKGWAVPGKGYGGKIVALLGQIMAFEVPQTSTPSEPEEQEPEFPAYQLEGLETLTEAGVINSPEFWRQKFSEQVTVGEMFGILGKLFTKVTE